MNILHSVSMQWLEVAYLEDNLLPVDLSTTLLNDILFINTIQSSMANKYDNTTLKSANLK